MKNLDLEYNRKDGESMDDFIERLKKLDVATNRKASKVRNRVVRKFAENHDKKCELADPEYNRKDGESMDDFIERLKKLDARVR